MPIGFMDRFRDRRHASSHIFGAFRRNYSAKIHLALSIAFRCPTPVRAQGLTRSLIHTHKLSTRMTSPRSKTSRGRGPSDITHIRLRRRTPRGCARGVLEDVRRSPRGSLRDRALAHHSRRACCAASSGAPGGGSRCVCVCVCVCVFLYVCMYVCVCFQICQLLHVKDKLFGIAGTKDRRAITTQVHRVSE